MSAWRRNLNTRCPSTLAPIGLPVRAPRLFVVSAAELAAHAEFLKKLDDPLWLEA